MPRKKGTSTKTKSVKPAPTPVEPELEPTNPIGIEEDIPQMPPPSEPIDEDVENQQKIDDQAGFKNDNAGDAEKWEKGEKVDLVENPEDGEIIKDDNFDKELKKELKEKFETYGAAFNKAVLAKVQSKASITALANDFFGAEAVFHQGLNARECYFMVGSIRIPEDGIYNLHS